MAFRSFGTKDRTALDAYVQEKVDPWRRLLWLNHARYLPFQHIPYGDDGEMQCCGIDFKRLSAEKIEELLRANRAKVSP